VRNHEKQIEQEEVVELVEEKQNPISPVAARPRTARDTTTASSQTG
jgi:hypothetical protein